MVGTDTLVDLYKTDFLMIKEHEFRLTELWSMLPFERQIYVHILLEYLEKKKEILAKQSTVF